MWSRGFAARFAPRSAWRTVSLELFERAQHAVRDFQHIRPIAYAAIGLAHHHTAADPLHAQATNGLMRHLAARFTSAFEGAATPDWRWFEETLTYDNARLSEACIRLGVALGDRALVAIGLETLAFLESIVYQGDLFVPIGNDGWYPRGGRRAVYDQQPLEAAAMVDAEIAAHDVTGDDVHRHRAERAYAWFSGGNLRGIRMAVAGGCYDGLGQDHVNPNMGAESTLAHLAAAYALARSAPRLLQPAP